MSDKHLSSQFDAELNSISSNVLEMGGLVESQLHQAIYALVHMSQETAGQVIETENRINQICLLYTSPSPRDKRQSRMPSSA